MSKILRTHIRQLIQELWSKNKVTLGDPKSKDFFKSQSRTLYGYGYGKKPGDKEYRLGQLINVVNKKNKPIANELKGFKNNISKIPILSDVKIFEAVKKDLPSAYRLIYFLKYFFTDNFVFNKSDSFSENEIYKILEVDKKNPKITKYINKFENFKKLNEFKDYVETHETNINYSDKDSLSKVLDIISQLDKLVGFSPVSKKVSSSTTTPTTATIDSTTSSITTPSTATSTGRQGIAYSYTPSKKP